MQPEVVPNARVDLLVTDATGRPRRSTTYSGIIRFGPSPVTQLLGRTALQNHHAGLGPFTWTGFVPDGLPYVAAHIADAVVVPELALVSVHENAYLQTAGARLAPDPRGTPQAWVELNASFVGEVSAVYAYRVQVLVAPEAVEPPSSS